MELLRAPDLPVAWQAWQMRACMMSSVRGQTAVLLMGAWSPPSELHGHGVTNSHAPPCSASTQCTCRCCPLLHSLAVISTGHHDAAHICALPSLP